MKKGYIVWIKGNDIFNYESRFEAENFEESYLIAKNIVRDLQKLTIEKVRIVSLHEYGFCK